MIFNVIDPTAEQFTASILIQLNQELVSITYLKNPSRLIQVPDKIPEQNDMKVDYIEDKS